MTLGPELIRAKGDQSRWAEGPKQDWSLPSMTLRLPSRSPGSSCPPKADDMLATLRQGLRAYRRCLGFEPTGCPSGASALSHSAGEIKPRCCLL